jgi:large repetitive protein
MRAVGPSWLKQLLGFLAFVLAQLIFASSAIAQTSTYCPTPLTINVANGGSGSVNVSNCDGPFDGGMSDGPPATPPAHGTYIIGANSGGVQFISYSHSGNSATSDTFTLRDNDNGIVRINVVIAPASSPISVSPGTLTTLTAGTPFSQTLSATGGAAPYAYSLSAGALPIGLSLSSGGVLSGTPTQRGNYSFSVLVTDATAPTAQTTTKSYSGSVQNPTLSLTTTSGTAIQSIAFSQTLSTSGGVLPHIYQLETGSFPAGISISSAGVVSGTTSAAAGNYPVVLRVTDASTPSAAPYAELENYTLTVNPPPSVSIAVSPASVSEDGGTNLTYTVTRSQNLSSATVVNLTTAGTATTGTDFSGALSTVTIPAGATTASVTINPTADATGESSETVILTVIAGTGYTVGAPSSATGTITNDDGTSAFCPTLTATVAWGGSVSINAGACNAGFGLGVVLAQPTHGTATIGAFGANQPIIYSHNGSSGTTDTFTVNDGEPPPNNQIRVNITITPPTSSIVVNPATLSAITVGMPFSQTLTSTGGTGPYTYTLASGTLPPGLNISNGGVISGTATSRDPYNFTVRSQDSLGAFSNKGYSGTVALPTLSLATNAGTAIQSIAFSQTLVTNGGIAPYAYQMETGTLPAGITLSSGGILSGTTSAAPGSFPVTIRVTDASTGPGSYFEVENFTLTVSPPPSVSISVAPASVSEDGATNLVYTVTRSLNLSSPTTVNITTTGTAALGSDYSGASSTVTIPANATTATITIDPSVDGTVEADETVILTVASGTGYTVGAPASATGTILNDDVPTATIAVSPASAAEDGAPNLVYTVTLSQASFSALSLNYTISGTATNGTDYATITSPLVIPAGNTVGTITINPTADTTIEADETVALTLSAGTGYTVGIPNAASGTILNDDLPNLTINDVTGAEGNSGTTNFTFTASLSAPAGPGGVTFDIATANGSAVGGTDYVTQSLTGQTIPAGSSSYTFSVAVNGDALNEPNETFFVNVTNAVNAIVVDGQGIGTITNDDPLPSLSINDVSVTEGNSGTVNAVFTVTLSAASGQTVSVNYATADGTAAQPGDYSSTSGTSIFPIGATIQTITVPVVGETAPEVNETFFVNLSGATNATIADNQGLGSITNDDVPVTVSPVSLPNSTVAAAYSQTVTASGGVAPYGFAVTAGALPTGLALSPSGVLSGTPTAGGIFNFTVTGTDSSGAPGPFGGSQAYTVTIAAPTITFPASTLAGGTLGSPYTASITAASGGTAPFSYAVTAGALPGSLALNAANGTIAGTPNALGSFNFTITATDGSTGTGPYTATQSYAINVIDMAPIASASSLIVAYNATATNVPLSLSGGTATSLAVGAPASNGTVTVSGTTISYQPNAGYAGSDSFTYTATNSGGTSAPATVSLTVSDPVVTVTASSGLTTSVGTTYSQTFSFNGGATPWSGYQVTNLPAGLSVTASTANSVTVSGTPTQAGSFSLNVSATDSSIGNGPFTVGQAFTLAVAGPTLSLTPAAGVLTAPYGAPYTLSFTASGGIGGYSYTQGGSLPPGLSFSAGSVSGTPTTPGSYAFSITATDTGSTGIGAPFSIIQNYTLDVPSPTIAVTPASLPGGTAAALYTQTINASGGVSPLTFAVSSGSLPAGLTLSSGGNLAGTPTEVGSFTFSITATDTNGQSGSRSYTLVIAAPTLALTPATGSFNVAYGGTASQSFIANGGNGPYSYVASGSLPAGVTLNTSSGALSGSSIAVGTYNFTITATDTGTSGAGAPFTVAGNYTLVVAPPVVAITPASLPAATVGSSYSNGLAASGGAAPYSFVITAGALPAGLNLSSSGVLSGIPTAGGSFTFTVTASDASPAPGPFTAIQAYTLVVAAPVITLPPTNLVGGQRGSVYSATLNPAAGGTAPFSYAVTAGALPAGVTLSSSGALSGTPTVFGSFAFTVTATDTSSGSGPYSASQNYTLAIVDQPPVAGGVTVSLAYGAPATPIVLNLTGGTATSVAIAAAPANGTATVSGTTISYQPNASFSGTDSFTYTATNGGGISAPATVTITVGAPTLSVNASGPLTATVGAPYTQTFTFAGGTAPFGSLQVAGLPAGLALTGTTVNSVTISGTPRVQGTFTLSVSASDSSTGSGPFVASQSFTLTVAPPNLSVAPASGSFAAPYAAPFRQSFTASGGIGGYSYVLGGSLPAGVTLNSATGTVSGTPTTTGSFAFTITATDNGAAGPGAPFTAQGSYTLAVAAPTIAVTPATLPNATAGTAYSATLSGSGAVAPYGFTLSGGALPAGVTLSATGQLSGTPTASGSFPFTVSVRDANGQTGTASLTLAVNVPTITITPSTLPAAVQGIAYSQTVTASGGIAPYRFAVSAGSLPAGLTLNPATGAITGTPSGSGIVSFTITVTDSTTGTVATASIAYALQITARPDPANDPEVRGLVQAQVMATRRFADAQVNNFMRRLEGMHGNGGGSSSSGGFQNSLRFSTPGYCEDSVTAWTNALCSKSESKLGPVAAANENSSSDGSGAGSDAWGAKELPWTIWAGGTIRFGDRDPTTGRLRQNFESEGISFGADYRFSPTFAAGIGVGLGRDTAEVGDNGSQSKGEAKTVAVYGSHQLGSGFYVDWLGGYQWLDFDLRRYVTSTGVLINSNRTGRQWFATGSTGADIETGNWLITPYARIDLTRGTLNGYSESSGSLFDLRFLDQDVNITSIGIGTRVNYRYDFRGGTLLPRLRLEYQYDIERSADARVAYLDLINGPFSTIPLTGLAREQLMLGLGAELQLENAIALELEYLNRIASGSGSDQAVQVGVSVKF